MPCHARHGHGAANAMAEHHAALETEVLLQQREDGACFLVDEVQGQGAGVAF